MPDAIPPSVNALLKLREKLCAELRTVANRERSLRAKLVQVDGVLRMLGEADPEFPGKRRKAAISFAKREARRRVLDVLRDAPEPLTTSQIAVRIMEAKGLSADDPDAVKDVQRAVAAVLRRGVEFAEVGRDGREKRWLLGS
ncbi:hypothetical protein [Azospirillum soli]|uniref:hypothetical protein n=1 Tax=Azospirillum soli TaxID=1304799 RepID=UPI001AE13C58|nr:hypothetical protein [Azospirillum soli]MBP2316949.1 hypothetical protein [Azospirillum soli]